MIFWKKRYNEAREEIEKRENLSNILIKTWTHLDAN